MAGDLDIGELAVLEDGAGAAADVLTPESPARVIHRYGRVSILAVPDDAAAAALPPAADLSETADGLDDVERQGLAALLLRESEDYRGAKRNRPRAGEDWDMPDCTTVVPPPSPARAAAARGPVRRRAHTSKAPWRSASSSCRGRRPTLRFSRRRAHQGRRRGPERPGLLCDGQSARRASASPTTSRT